MTLVLNTTGNSKTAGRRAVRPPAWIRLMCSVALLLGSSGVWAQSADNLLAHQLYERGDYARAAEIFTDPAWKGAALYRSSQWWRAAEAFVRANDPVSQFNLGNCYVQLGYYALALDAYKRSLSMSPDFDDAQFNHDLMQKLLADSDPNSEQAGTLESRQEAIDEVEADSDSEASQAGSGDQDSDRVETGRPGQGGEQQPTENSANQGKDGDGGKADEEQQTPDGAAGLSNVEGLASDENAEDRPSGGASSDVASNASEAAGIRAELEDEQAIEQWLNRIRHDPYRYLQKRIQLDLRRRQAAGQSAPDGGSTW